MRRAALGAATPAIILVVLLLAPFLGKAFTIDDTLFLREAEQARKDPLHPSAFEMVWSEIPAPTRFSRIQPSGPLQAYLLLPTIWSGGSEHVAHLTQLILLAAALWATASLALRLNAGPRVAAHSALLLAATPAVLGMAGTAMPDIAAMTLGIVGIESACAWSSEGKRRHALFALFALGLAPVARSHAILLVPIAILLARTCARPRAPGSSSRVAWLVLIAVPLSSLLVLLVTSDPDPAGGSPWGAARFFSSPIAVGRNLLAFLVHWTLVFPLGVVWWAARGEVLVRRWSTALFLALALILATVVGDAWVGLLVVVAAGLGGSALCDVLIDGWRRKDPAQLALGLSLLAPVVIVPYIHMPSKYLVIAAPALAIALARVLARASRARSMTILAGAVCAGALLGVLILRADAVFADLGRRAARELIAPAVATGRAVWFGAHWGFQWYAEKAGGRPLTVTAPLPSAGDLVVTSTRLPGIGADAFSDLRLVRSLGSTVPGGRVMDERVGAGFYSNAWGYFPWAWSNLDLDRFDLFELEAPGAGAE